MRWVEREKKRRCYERIVYPHKDSPSQAKKDVSQIFNNLLRRQIGTRWPTVEYLSSKPEVLFTALKG